MNTIVVTGKESEGLLDDIAKINEHTLRGAFQLKNEVPIGLSIIIDEEVCLSCREFERGQFYFVLPKERENLEFRLTWDEQRRSRPRSSLDAHPELPYPEAPSPPPPMSKFIDKWMFYAVDSAGKSTVVCIHPRYFVTFRHGTHLQLQVGSVIRIFHAKSETNEQDGYEVTVMDLNEKLDFILLRSKEIIVPKAPRLAIAEKSENFLLAGFGDQNTEQQQLAYLHGIFHSIRGYYFSVNDRPALLMGPFVLGAGQSSRGDSTGTLNIEQVVKIGSHAGSGKLALREYLKGKKKLRAQVGKDCFRDYGFPKTVDKADEKITFQKKFFEQKPIYFNVSENYRQYFINVKNNI